MLQINFIHNDVGDDQLIRFADFCKALVVQRPWTTLSELKDSIQRYMRIMEIPREDIQIEHEQRSIKVRMHFQPGVWFSIINEF